MRRVCWTPVNQYGDAIFAFINITPPDEEMARHKYRQAKEEYGDELLEDFDKALKEEEYSVYLKLASIKFLVFFIIHSFRNDKKPHF